eukprot:6591848-Ditylum_brightwellii.AAC.1
MTTMTTMMKYRNKQEQADTRHIQSRIPLANGIQRMCGFRCRDGNEKQLFEQQQWNNTTVTTAMTMITHTYKRQIWENQQSDSNTVNKWEGKYE